MLSKCTNLSCSASFRHLADGRLFQLENDSPVAASKATEYFWLCSRCSAAMTLRLAHDGNVAATELPQARDERSRTQLNGLGESASPPQCQLAPHHSSERHIESLRRDAHSASKRKLAALRSAVREQESCEMYDAPFGGSTASYSSES